MHIFIDESGTFSSPGTATVSAVGALVIPDRRLPYVLRRYEKLRPLLPQEKGEVKGRLLSEAQVSQVVSLLKNKEAIFEIVTTDMELHSEEMIDAHRRGQAHAMTVNLTSEHRPSVHEGVRKLREQLEGLSQQLYVQSVLTFELIAHVIRHTTLYYAQRLSRELEFFHWVVDAKDPRQTTPWEDWWSFVVMPILQTKFLREPVLRLKGADYSHYERRFEVELGDFHKGLVPDSTETRGSDIRKIMTESLRFSSLPEPGLELVDILTNAVRRGMTGNLQHEGWKDIRSLMIHGKDHYIRVLVLAPTRDAFDRHRPYAQMLNHFKSGGLNMIF